MHVTVRIVFASFRTENRSTLNEKNLLQRSKFFPFRVDPFSEGPWCAENKQEVTKSHKF